MSIASLRSKARRNALEVEHIIAAAKARLPGLCEVLNELSHEYGWSESTHLPDGTHVVPLAKWSAVAGAYAEGGEQALEPFAARPGDEPFVIGILGEIRTDASLSALIAFFSTTMDTPDRAPEAAWRLVSAFNHLLSTKDAIVPTQEQAARVRLFPMRCLQIADAPARRASVLYALRGVGDASSLELIRSLEDLPCPHETARTSAIRAIRRRQRHEC